MCRGRRRTRPAPRAAPPPPPTCRRRRSPTAASTGQAASRHRRCRCPGQVCRDVLRWRPCGPGAGFGAFLLARRRCLRQHQYRSFVAPALSRGKSGRVRRRRAGFQSTRTATTEAQSPGLTRPGKCRAASTPESLARISCGGLPVRVIECTRAMMSPFSIGSPRSTMAS